MVQADSLAPELVAQIRAAAEQTGIDFEIFKEQELARRAKLMVTSPKVKIEIMHENQSHNERPEDPITSPQPSIKPSVTPREKRTSKRRKPQTDSTPDDKSLTTNKEAYNLRKRRYFPSASIENYSFNPKTVSDTDCFKDLILSKVDLSNYHNNSVKDQYADKILDLSRVTHRSQLDTFVHKTKKYFMMSCLTNVRIFEFNHQSLTYNEAKRIPNRLLDIAPNIVLSAHFCDDLIYLAHIADGTRDSQIKSYIKVWDLHGRMVKKPYYYPELVRAISSDTRFIYVIMLNNVVYVHRKEFFNIMTHRIDLTPCLKGLIVSFSARMVVSNPYTRLELATATSTQMLITMYDVFEKSIWQNYNFDKSYVTRSCYDGNSYGFYILRNLKSSREKPNSIYYSVIEVGQFVKSVDKKTSRRYFIHTKSIFSKLRISQMEPGPNQKLYLLGAAESGAYEIGCLDLADLSHVWAASLTNVEPGCKILPQEDHVVIVSGNQKFRIIDVSSNSVKTKSCATCKIQLSSTEKIEHDLHPGILRDLEIIIHKPPEPSDRDKEPDDPDIK